MLTQRPLVGCVGQVLQRQDLLFKRITTGGACIITVREGAKDFDGAAGRMTVRAGGAIVLAEAQVCDVTNHVGRSGCYRATVLEWDASVIAAQEAPGPTLRHAALLPSLTTDFAEALDAATRAITHPDAVPLAVAQHRMAELLLWLAEQGLRFAASTPKSFGQTLIQRIAQHPGEDWSLEHTAALCAVSQTTLRRKLAQEGLGLRDLVTEARMTAALTLLQTSAAPVGQIALDLGYDSASRFTARFKQRFGFVPSDIRNPKAVQSV